MSCPVCKSPGESRGTNGRGRTEFACGTCGSVWDEATVIDVAGPGESQTVQLLREVFLGARIPTRKIEERNGTITIELEPRAANALAVALATLEIGTGVVRGVVDLVRGSRR